ncbi:MAG TPA: SpoIID/LytB domain-containing protein [Bacteroidia bacterium]
MIRKQFFCLCLLLFTGTLSLHAHVVSVRILTSRVINTFIFSPFAGTYKVIADGRLISGPSDEDAEIFQMSISGDSILIKTFEKTIGKFSSVKFFAMEPSSAFKIKAVVPESKLRMYDENLEVMLSADKKQFLLINKVDLEKYISGVVESESGTRTSIEYYKLQSILCRTYLLANLNRHIADGYQVCDDVHCQAYLSRTKEADIANAVSATKGLVVVDSDLNLITAAFHSNCGGQTVNSQDVWSVSTSYLKSVKDTFCMKMPHAKWQRSIPVEDWKSYLQLKHKYPVDDTVKMNNANNFFQNNGRSIYFIDKDLKIPLKVIRADFQLKSTYFSIEQKGANVIFNGRGYGHGVGLCQEGAMKMAKQKHTYKNILSYYYKDVHLVDLSALTYFRQE